MPAKLRFLPLALAFTLPALAADGFTLSSGFDYSSGQYGTSDTTRILVVPITGRYDQGPWTWKLTLPWLDIRGPANGVSGTGDSTVVVSGKGNVAGWGDLVASAGYNLWYDAASKTGLDVTAKLKLPTADSDRGLGTGKADQTLQLDGFKSLGKTSLFGGLGYRWMGKPADKDYRNIGFASVGLAQTLTEQTSVGAVFDFRQSVLTSQDNQRELTVYLAHKLDAHWKAQLYAYAGAGNASPDWGSGLALSYRF